ncbi:MAG: hypothetical protein KDD36_11745 [Flavobacteriales bacterium]|nr:hypothetical protein [Flavobacteriales bacterium]
MKRFVIMSWISVISACASNPEIIRIHGKWNFFESDAMMCGDCIKNSPRCCVFAYNGKRYLRAESYVLDKEGRIDSVYSYTNPLGVNIMALNEMKYLIGADTSEYFKLGSVEISWDARQRLIRDCQRSVRQFTIDAENNYLVLTENGKLTIYEYVIEE